MAGSTEASALSRAAVLAALRLHGGGGCEEFFLKERSDQRDATTTCKVDRVLRQRWNYYPKHVVRPEWYLPDRHQQFTSSKWLAE